MSTVPMIVRKISVARVICTQIPKLPTVDSIRSPQGYESMSQPFSIRVLTVLFHQVRYSGVLSQKYP